MNKNVRFQGEPAPDYYEPEADYDDSPADYDGREEPVPDYDHYDDNDTMPLGATAAAAAQDTGTLRQISRSADTEHDLSAMENLNEASILRVLEERFSHDVIQVCLTWPDI